jgi:phenylacetate-CoA ligase
MLPAVTFNLLRHARAIKGALAFQWKPSSYIRDWQNARLGDIIAHAYRHVPFYKKRMNDLHLSLADIRTIEDLLKFPLTTKPELRAGFPDDVVADGYGDHNAILHTTSGSSGSMLKVYHDRFSHDYTHALAYRFYHNIGYRLWHKRAYFRWEPFPCPFPLESLGLGRRYHIPLEISPAKQFAMLKKIKPDIITAYPSNFQILIKSLPPGRLREISPKVVASNSETLIPELAALIKESFGCDVFDEYSSLEVLPMAFECPLHRYHIVSDNVIMECIDESGNPLEPGLEGEIVVTGLINKAMPFIRYRTGDFGALDEDLCPCGRTLPVLKKIIGRKDDLIRLPDNSFCNPNLLTGAIEYAAGVIEFQIIQKNREEIEINIVAQKEASQKEITQEVLKRLDRILGHYPITLRVIFVDSIKYGATGKKKAVIVEPAARESITALGH